MKQGQDHPGWKHGGETLEAKAERSKKLAELREIETIGHAIGLFHGPRWRGRKPVVSQFEF